MQANDRVTLVIAACTLQVTVELKNDLAISGTLHSVDQYLNIKLNNVHVINETKYPHMVSSSHFDVTSSPMLPGKGFHCA